MIVGDGGMSLELPLVRRLFRFASSFMAMGAGLPGIKLDLLDRVTERPCKMLVSLALINCTFNVKMVLDPFPF